MTTHEERRMDREYKHFRNEAQKDIFGYEADPGEEWFPRAAKPRQPAQKPLPPTPPESASPTKSSFPANLFTRQPSQRIASQPSQRSATERKEPQEGGLFRRVSTIVRRASRRASVRSNIPQRSLSTAEARHQLSTIKVQPTAWNAGTIFNRPDTSSGPSSPPPAPELHRQPSFHRQPETISVRKVNNWWDEEQAKQPIQQQPERPLSPANPETIHEGESSSFQSRRFSSIQERPEDSTKPLSTTSRRSRPPQSHRQWSSNPFSDLSSVRTSLPRAEEAEVHRANTVNVPSSSSSHATMSTVRRSASLSARHAGDMSHRPLEVLKKEHRAADRSPGTHHRVKKSPTDIIDGLDNSFGVAVHHDGPYDATLASRNVNTAYPPVEAVRESNMEALKATPREYIQDSLTKHVPLQGVATIPPGMTDMRGKVMEYNEGADLMRESDAAGGAYKRWPGVPYLDEDLKGKGEPSFTVEKDHKEQKKLRRAAEQEGQPTDNTFEMRQGVNRRRASTEGSTSAKKFSEGIIRRLSRRNRKSPEEA